MPRLRHTVEQILAKLREAEVSLSKGHPRLPSAKFSRLSPQADNIYQRCPRTTATD